MKIKTKRLVAVIASFVILALFVLGAFVPLLSRSLSSADEIDEPQRDPVPNPGSNSYRPWTIWGNSSSSTFGQTSWLWPDTARNVSLTSAYRSERSGKNAALQYLSVCFRQCMKKRRHNSFNLC